MSTARIGKPLTAAAAARIAMCSRSAGLTPTRWRDSIEPRPQTTGAGHHGDESLQVGAICYRRTSGEFQEHFLIVTVPWQSCSAATFLMAEDAPPQREPHTLLRPYLRRPEPKKGPYR